MLELNKIYNEDCLEGMTQLQDNSINCIVTSPPYNLGGDFHTTVAGKRVTYGDYKGYKDKLPEKDYQGWQIDFINESYRVLKDDGVMFYNHKNRIVKGETISPFEWLHKTQFNINQVIVMDLRSTANVDKRRFFPVHELIFVLTKEKGLKLNNHECHTDVWEIKKRSRRQTGHPATFHPEVPRRCIEASTQEGDIVLDPFAGIGTTCQVAKELNRRYIGFEIGKEYCEIANERIKEAIELKSKEGEKA